VVSEKIKAAKDADIREKVSFRCTVE
jgi:hypothetical protein